MYFSSTSDMVAFFGRFHPVLVHLPIGVLFFAVFLYLLSRFKKYSYLTPVVDLTLFWGTVSAVAAVVTGFLLSNSGQYDETLLFQHKWIGVSTAALALAAYVVRKIPFFRHTVNSDFFFALILPFMAVCLAVTGHLGGSLTHGSNYLVEYAPVPAQKLLNPDSQMLTTQKKVDLGSALLFEDAVQAIFRQKCAGCHNTEKKSGGLDLTSLQAVMNGGESGRAVQPGSVETSELIRRVTLEPSSDFFMPPEGKTPLTRDETALIEWWIMYGAMTGQKVAQLDLPENLLDSVKKTLKIEESETTAISAVDPQLVGELETLGFSVRQLSQKNPMLDVIYTGGQGSFSRENLDALIKVKDQVAWLDLSSCGLQDDDLTVISEFNSCARLILSHNAVTDAGIAHLTPLAKLEVLNLVNTKATDESVTALTEMKNLKSLYVWQTGVTTVGVERLKQNHPELKVVGVE